MPSFAQLQFMQNNPAVYSSLFWFTLASAVGQAFIFFLIRHSGALVNTQVTTLRKMFSILYTVVANGDNLKGEQWGCILLVFVGIYVGESGGK